MMSEAEAVQALDAMPTSLDVAQAHIDADDILLAFAPLSIREAYERLTERIEFWYA